MKTKFLIAVYIACTVFVSCNSSQQTEEEKKIENLLSQMTLEEKLGQMNQLCYDGNTYTDWNKELQSGRVGSVLNITDTAKINEFQRIVVNESRLGIPIIIGRDVIHGFKTIFPIPLGQAASFNPETVKIGAEIAAVEARSVGITWTFAPMLDISRDPRWGRIAESLGEDPYLASQLGAAMVQGFQGDDLSSQNTIAACVKHFIGYGAAEGGRDYNTTNIPPHLLRNIYLPPFNSAIKTGAATLMTSFNDNDGIPASGNRFLLRDVLRNEWNFDGFVVSDWASMEEMIPHGFAKDGKQVAEISLNAGVDMEMVSEQYIKHLPELLKEGKVSEKLIDDAVRNILRVKFRLGLFERPYIDMQAPSVLYAENHLKAAREAAMESAILLKNDNNTLPLKQNIKIAVIGPMADAPYDQMGTWVFDGEKEHTVTPLKALQTEFTELKYTYVPALTHSRDNNKADFGKAKSAAAQADVAVVFLGEESILSGEAHSLADINLIGVQSELLQVVKSAGKPVVLVIMAGRPLTIERDLPYADAVLYNFHPGTMGGSAIWNLLLGKANPSGKLPVTFPRHVGQVPMYYNHNNTGRPPADWVKMLHEIPLEAEQTSLGNRSYYLDYGYKPLFPFGYGLSYSKFEYSDLKLSAEDLKMNDTLTVNATIKNTSDTDGTEVVQLYIQDIVGSIARPVKELKGFRRIPLKAGKTETVQFKLTSDDLAFWGKDMTRKAEEGDFKIWIGSSSNPELEAKFTLINK